MDPLTFGLIGMGANLLGGVFNNQSQQSMNAQQMRFAVQMYERQRKDALADWNMQNEYNTPSAQMSRYKQAGLNPNLIYGQGSSGLSQPVRSSSVSQPQLKAPTALADAFGNSLSAFQDTQIKMQQYDNLKKQGDLLDTENLLKIITGANKMADTDLKRFDLDYKTSTAPVSAEILEQKLRNMQFDLSSGQIKLRMQLDRNESEIAKNSQSIQESINRIARYRKLNAKTDKEIENLDHIIENTDMRTENTQWDIMLKMYEKKLNDMGLTKNSPEYMTMIANFFNMLVDKVNQAGSQDYKSEDFKKGMKSHF